MKAVQVRTCGGPEVLQLAEVPRPTPGPGEVLLRVAASGVNFADTRARAGGYVDQPKLPFIPGFEATGWVESLGPGAEAMANDPALLKPGTPVMPGDATCSYAEFCVAPADLIFRLPEGHSLLEAAALPVSYVAAWLALFHKGRLVAGETVLVHAAGGGVGSAAVQIARWAGARVVAAASSEAKLEVARRAGADVTVRYGDVDFRTEVRDILGSNQPIDLVVDSVGGQLLSCALGLLRERGRAVNFGQASDDPLKLDLYESVIPYHLDLRFFARGRLTRSRHLKDRAILHQAMDGVVSLWARGDIGPVCVNYLPLESAGAAHEGLGRRASRGKYVLEVAG